MYDYLTRRIALVFMLAAVAAFAIAGCDDDDPAGPGQDIDDIPITVSAGLTPTYTWEGGPVWRLVVRRAGNLDDIVWGVQTPGLDSIRSGVVHGLFPDTSGSTIYQDVPLIGDIEEDTLTSNVGYQVEVRRLDGTVGRRTFIP